MDDTILTAARKVGTDESADAICKVLPILALVCPSLTEQDGGENALRTKISVLFPKENRNLNENYRFWKLNRGTFVGEGGLSRLTNSGAFPVMKTED